MLKCIFNRPWLIIALTLLLTLAVSARPGAETTTASAGKDAAPWLVVLGIAQDAGYPQAGDPEGPAWHDPSQRRHAACLGLVDPVSGERWLFEATPDFKEQLHRFDDLAPAPPQTGRPGLAGIFLTHAHMGHYTGLAHLGREVLGARQVPVWAMPRMEAFLRGNGPWEQLVKLENIVLQPLRNGVTVQLSPRLTVTPIQVPHRDEYSETVAYRIAGPRHAALFLPDIDKWERWDAAGGRIESHLATVDVAYLDGSFLRDGEIPGRAMSEIPHPFIEESMRRFAVLPASERAKIRFIHFNRTNPVLSVKGEPIRQSIREAGFGIAEELERFEL